MNRDNMPEYTVEVYYREQIPDVFALGIEKSIEELGISSVDSVKVSELYRFRGTISLARLKEISEKILADAVVQEYAVYDSIPETKGYWVVEVWFRKGVTDTVADTTEEAIKDTGIKASFSVATGRKYYLKGNLTGGDIRTISEKILSNSLIHDCVINNFT